MSIKRIFASFILFFACNLLLAQPHLRLASISGPNFPGASDTAYQYISYVGITIQVQNLDTTFFNDTLDILIKGDTGTRDSIYVGFAQQIAPGDSATITANPFVFKPTNFDDGDNIVVIWPAARNVAVQTTDSLSFHIFYISNASFIDDVKKEPVKLYPNPATGFIYLGNEVNLKFRRVRIYEDSGRIVYEDSKMNRFIAIDQWKCGQYLIDIEKQDGTHQILKLIKVN